MAARRGIRARTCPTFRLGRASLAWFGGTPHAPASAAQEGNTLLDTTAGHQGNELYTGAAQEDKQSLDSAVDHEGGLSVLKTNPTAREQIVGGVRRIFWCQHVPRRQYMCPCRRRVERGGKGGQGFSTTTNIEIGAAPWLTNKSKIGY